MSGSFVRKRMFLSGLLFLSSPLLAAEPIPSESTVHVDQLNACAKEVVKQQTPEEALRRLGISPTPNAFASAFSICVRMAEGLVCGGGESAPQFHRVRAQIAEAATFLSDIYVDALGDTHRPYLFQELILVPGEFSKPTLELQGTRLFVAIPRGMIFGAFKPLSARDLRRLWDSGAHLHKDAKEKKYWRFLNPVGEFRVGIRHVLVKLRLKLGARLQELENRLAVEKRKALIHLPSDSESAESIRQRISSLDDALVERLFERVQAKVRDPKSLDDLENAGMARIAESRSARDYSIWILGALSGYGNEHDVHVGVAYSRWAQFVRATENPRRTRVVVTGFFFAGYTIDNISVNLDFAGSLEAGAITDALDEIEN